jgi:hypothetical protein
MYNTYFKSTPEIERRVSFTKSGVTAALIITADSGRIIYRGKIDTVIGVAHPGIILGQDIWGETWVIHNHYLNGRTEIETLAQFCNGQEWFFDDRQVFYNRFEIIDRAITQWLAKEKYNWLTNNCQHFVNRVTRNEHKSDTIDRVSNNVMLGGGILALFGALTGNKTLRNIGLTVAGTGLAGKGISRIS